MYVAATQAVRDRSTLLPSSVALTRSTKARASWTVGACAAGGAWPRAATANRQKLTIAGRYRGQIRIRREYSIFRVGVMSHGISLQARRVRVFCGVAASNSQSSAW